MKKKLSLILVFSMIVSLFSGCTVQPSMMFGNPDELSIAESISIPSYNDMLAMLPADYVLGENLFNHSMSGEQKDLITEEALRLSTLYNFELERNDYKNAILEDLYLLKDEYLGVDSDGLPNYQTILELQESGGVTEDYLYQYHILISMLLDYDIMNKAGFEGYIDWKFNFDEVALYLDDDEILIPTTAFVYVENINDVDLSEEALKIAELNGDAGYANKIEEQLYEALALYKEAIGKNIVYSNDYSQMSAFDMDSAYVLIPTPLDMIIGNEYELTVMTDQEGELELPDGLYQLVGEDSTFYNIEGGVYTEYTEYDFGVGIVTSNMTFSGITYSEGVYDVPGLGEVIPIEENDLLKDLLEETSNKEIIMGEWTITGRHYSNDRVIDVGLMTYGSSFITAPDAILFDEHIIYIDGAMDLFEDYELNSQYLFASIGSDIIIAMPYNLDGDNLNIWNQDYIRVDMGTPVDELPTGVYEMYSREMEDEYTKSEAYLIKKKGIFEDYDEAFYTIDEKVSHYQFVKDFEEPGEFYLKDGIYYDNYYDGYLVPIDLEEHISEALATVIDKEQFYGNWVGDNFELMINSDGINFSDDYDNQEGYAFSSDYIILEISEDCRQLVRYEMNQDGSLVIGGETYHRQPDLITEYVLTIDATEGGETTIANDYYAYGEDVNLVAYIYEGYEFIGWYVEDEKVSENTNYTFEIKHDLVVTAKFAKELMYDISITTQTGGTLVKDLNGTYELDSILNLSASKSSGYDFDGWYIDGEHYSNELSTTYKVLNDVTIEARFSKTYVPSNPPTSSSSTEYTLKLTSSEGGKVENYEGSKEFGKNSEVNLKAVSEHGYEFVRWEGSFDSTNNEITITVNKDKELKAIFKKIDYGFVSSEWAHDYVQELHVMGILSTDDYSDYSEEITRKEFATIMVKFYEKQHGEIMITSEDNPFTDINNNYVTKAYKVDLFKGIGNDMFNPDGMLTREQLATVTSRYLQEQNPTESMDYSDTEFNDFEDVSWWAQAHVKHLNEKGFMIGWDNKFHPVSILTIEESVAVVMRLLKQ